MVYKHSVSVCTLLEQITVFENTKLSSIVGSRAQKKKKTNKRSIKLSTDNKNNIMYL